MAAHRQQDGDDEGTDQQGKGVEGDLDEAQELLQRTVAVRPVLRAPAELVQPVEGRPVLGDGHAQSREDCQEEGSPRQGDHAGPVEHGRQYAQPPVEEGALAPVTKPPPVS